MPAGEQASLPPKPPEIVAMEKAGATAFYSHDSGHWVAGDELGEIPEEDLPYSPTSTAISLSERYRAGKQS